MRRAALLALLCVGASCGRQSNDGTWGSGSGPDFCVASRLGGASEIAFTLRDGGSSGISIYAPDFASTIFGREYPELRLVIDGTPVRARALGAFWRDKQGIDFLLNLRPVLRRHPRGFRLAVHRDGDAVYETEIGEDALPSLRALLECDRGRRFGSHAAAVSVLAEGPQPHGPSRAGG